MSMYLNVCEKSSHDLIINVMVQLFVCLQVCVCVSLRVCVQYMPVWGVRKNATGAAQGEVTTTFLIEKVKDLLIPLNVSCVFIIDIY